MAHAHNYSQWTVLLVAVSMVLVPMGAMASHNSIGGAVQLVQADEYVRSGDNSGDLAPDVPSAESPGASADHPYVQSFHNNLDTPRSAPADQTGLRYHGGSCTEFGETDESTYLAGLDTGESCYVGYLDSQWEYIIFTSLLLTRSSSSLSVGPVSTYGANPSPNDDYCRGQGSEENREHVGPQAGIAPVDSAIARANRTIDPGCQGDTHEEFRPSFALIGIDTDLLEIPMQGTDHDGDGTGVADLVGSEEGSGVLTQPFMATNYVYLFGQPHPGVDHSDDPGFTAGEGVFGSDPGTGGSPIMDLTGACGDRTLECKLLTPDDIKAYDRNKPNVEDDQARVCSFEPQYVTVNPDQRSAGVCGVFGDVVNQYIDDTTHGGFGVEQAPPTWFHTLPGWHEGVLLLNHASSTVPLFGFADDYTDEEPGFADGVFAYTAVNPVVPEADHPIWCVRPNFLASGDGGGVIDQTLDPGFYGTYQADAIDSDVFTHALIKPFRDVRDLTHGPVRTVLGPVEALADDAGDAVNDLADQNLPPQAQEAIDRADYFESEDPEPHQQLGDNQFPFSRTFDAGLGCNAQGVVEVRTEKTTVDGGLRFDVDLQRTTFSLKDPTLFEGNLPARESQTTEGAWQTDAYSFSGSIDGVLDTNESGTLDPCATSNGQPQPDADFCPWRGLWDAYNPECSSFGGVGCGALLDQLGYDVNGNDTIAESGVGLYAVAKISGPVAVVDEDLSRPDEIQSRTKVLGTEDTTAQNCIIGISKGFQKHLPVHFGDVNGDGAEDIQDVEAELCPDQSGPNGVGDIFVVFDAFDDQSGTNRGSFSAAIDIVKLAPTPKAVQDNTNGLGADDAICVHGIWSVHADTTVAADTADSLELTGGNTYDFSDCDSLASTVQS